MVNENLESGILILRPDGYLVGPYGEMHITDLHCGFSSERGTEARMLLQDLESELVIGQPVRATDEGQTGWLSNLSVKLQQRKMEIQDKHASVSEKPKLQKHEIDLRALRSKSLTRDSPHTRTPWDARSVKEMPCLQIVIPAQSQSNACLHTENGLLAEPRPPKTPPRLRPSTPPSPFTNASEFCNETESPEPSFSPPVRPKILSKEPSKSSSSEGHVIMEVRHISSSSSSEQTPRRMSAMLETLHSSIIVRRGPGSPKKEALTPGLYTHDQDTLRSTGIKRSHSVPFEKRGQHPPMLLPQLPDICLNSAVQYAQDPATRIKHASLSSDGTGGPYLERTSKPDDWTVFEGSDEGIRRAETKTTRAEDVAVEEGVEFCQAQEDFVKKLQAHLLSGKEQGESEENWFLMCPL